MKTSRHILVAEMPYKLLSFLLKKKILSSFMDEVLKQHDLYNEDTTLEWTKRMYSYKIDIIFDCSIFWRDTVQGWSFWHKMSREWGEIWKPKTS